MTEEGFYNLDGTLLDKIRWLDGEGIRFQYGCKAIDELVGLVMPGTMVCFYGDSGTGKTTLAAYLPIAEIAKQNELPENGVFVVYDGDGGFAGDRFKQILEEYGFSKEQQIDILSRLWFFRPVDFKDQHDLTKALEKRLKEEDKIPLLLTSDAITSVYRGIILRTVMQYRASVIGQYQGKLDLQLHELRRLAVEYGCPAIVTTWSQSKIGKAIAKEGEYVPPEFDGIGGRVIKFLSKVLIRLEEPQEDHPERIALLKKHRAKPSGQARRFRLCDGGIEDV